MYTAFFLASFLADTHSIKKRVRDYISLKVNAVKVIPIYCPQMTNNVLEIF